MLFFIYDVLFKKEGLAFIDDNQANALSNVTVEKGDVLLNITGASVARSCVVPDVILPARVNQHVCILRPTKGLLSEYLNYLIISPKFKNNLIFEGGNNRATRQALTKKMIESLDIPLPSIDEQKRVSKSLENTFKKVQELKIELSNQINHLTELKNSILDAAFKGKL